MITKGQIVQFEQGDYDDRHVFQNRRAIVDFDIKEQLFAFLKSNHYAQALAESKNNSTWFDAGREEFVDFLTINGFVERLKLDEIVTVHLGSYEELNVRIV